MTSYLGRQAVVIVHGIGEQKPLSTLMGFIGGDASGTAGVLTAEETDAWYVGPDHVTNRLDLRRVTVNFGRRVPQPPADLSLDVRPMARQTQFFEYYWANHFRGTERRHLTEWARPLLFVRRETLTQEALIGPRGWRRLLGLAGIAVAWLGVALSLVALMQGSAELVPAEWVPGRRSSVYVAAAAFALAAIAIAGLLRLVTLLRTVALLVATGVAVSVLEGLGDTGRAELVWGWTLASAGVAAVTFLTSRRVDAPLLRWLTAISLLSLVASLVRPALAAPTERAGLGVLAAAAVTFATGLLGGVLLNVLGDAARYFTNSPGNLEDREAIRVGLVTLLSELHDRRDPVTGQHEYDRIVVVGHSLGSVIAYDALTALWSRRSPLLGLSYGPEEHTDALEQLLRQAENQVRLHPPFAQDQQVKGEFDPAMYRDLQDRLLRVTLADSHDTAAGERQPEGSRWIVSDLVTLGSPLTYAEALLVQGGEPALQEALRRRLLSRCPPVPQQSESQRGTPLRFRWWRGPGRGHGTHFHHAATFAPTRWTNLYYADDFVGGPLASQLGPGIRDLRLPTKDARRSLLRFVVRMPHTKYWRHANGADRIPRGFDESVKTLRDIVTTHPLVVKVRILPRQVEKVCEVLAQQGYLLPAPTDASDAEVRLQVYRPSSSKVAVRSWWLWAQPEVWCPADKLPDLVRALVDDGGLTSQSVRLG